MPNHHICAYNLFVCSIIWLDLWKGSFHTSTGYWLMFAELVVVWLWFYDFSWYNYMALIAYYVLTSGVMHYWYLSILLDVYGFSKSYNMKFTPDAWTLNVIYTLVKTTGQFWSGHQWCKTPSLYVPVTLLSKCTPELLVITKKTWLCHMAHVIHHYLYTWWSSHCNKLVQFVYSYWIISRSPIHAAKYIYRCWK